VPALLSSLINAPAGELSRVLAADGSRCCLREWLARVPDPRSRLGRWHPLVFVLALAVCAFTAAGHDSPTAIAEWAAGCSQATLAALGGRRDPWAGRIRPPGARTLCRIFGRIDAEAFNAAVCGYLAALAPRLAEELPEVTGTSVSSAAPPGQPPRPARRPCCRRRPPTARPSAARSAVMAARCTCCRFSTWPPGRCAPSGR